MLLSDQLTCCDIFFPRKWENMVLQQSPNQRVCIYNASMIKPHIATVGHSCWDSIYHITQMPAVGHKTLVSMCRSEPGGSAARTAMILSKWADVEMISVLGNGADPVTGQLVTRLNRCGVGVRFSVFDQATTAVSSVWLQSDGDRTIASCHTRDRPIRDDANLSHFEAALFDNNKPQLNRSVRAKLNQSCVTMLDVDSPVSNYRDLEGYRMVWFSNETYQQCNIDLTEVAQQLGCVVGVTNGGREVEWCDQGQRFSMLPPSISPRDTCGAGDIWRARLIEAVLLGVPLPAAVETACNITARDLSVGSTTS